MFRWRAAECRLFNHAGHGDYRERRHLALSRGAMAFAPGIIHGQDGQERRVPPIFLNQIAPQQI
jgi:hypothetical protein